MAVLPTPASPTMTRVIFGTTRHILSDTFNLVLSSDNRVQFSFPSHFSQVATVFLQGTIFTLGTGIRHTVPTAELLQSRIDFLFIQAEVAQNIKGFSTALPGNSR